MINRYLDKTKINIIERYSIKEDNQFVSKPDANKLESGIIKKGGGANIHFRGSQDKGKTMLMVMFYRHLVTECGFSSADGVGNLTLSKYGDKFQTLKGDDLHQYLWDLTHKPYRDKIVLIDEIDSEFPARFHQDREQTEIALRMWHNKKLRNYIMYTSHLGRGADLIFDFATNFFIYPNFPNWDEDKIDFTCVNNLDLEINDFEALGVYDIAGAYDRWELTEMTEEERDKERPSKRKKKNKTVNTEVTERDGVKKLRKIMDKLI